MKFQIKSILIPLTLSGILFVGACSSDNKTAKKTEQSSEEHNHTFACPMHPEVTGKEGDTCPKCGMKLEHNDNAGAANTTSYFMDFTTNPKEVAPNQEVTLSMIPKMKGKETEQVPLQEEHTKKIHLIVVSDDLSYFDHIHPEYTSDGSYQVKTKFPSSGKYTLFADYKPTGGNHTVDKLNTSVSGNAPAAKQYSADKLTGTSSDGFSVTLTPSTGKFETKTAMHISGAVQQNGKAVDPSALEDYLGAKAHMVVISLNEKEYLHVHPGVENGKFDLHTTFEKAGVHRGWIQFQSKGKLHTVDFVMNVKEGSGTSAQGHSDH